MSAEQWEYQSFDKATIIDRRHFREVKLPGMVDMVNIIPSRSDVSPTVRPDLFPMPDLVFSFIKDLNIPNTDRFYDGINTMTGLYGSDQITYLTRFLAYGSDNGDMKILSGTHSNGTISGTQGDSRVRGIDTQFLSKAYRGAILRVDTVGTNFTGGYYRWNASDNGTDEYYLTKVDGSDPGITGDLVSMGFASGSGRSTWTHGTVGSLRPGEFAFDDNENIALGFDTLYIRDTTSAPGSYSGETGRWGALYTGENISGSPDEWHASTSGTNEYYLRLIGGGQPSQKVVNIFVSMMSFRKDGAYRMASGNIPSGKIISAGTLGSLADGEYAIGDNDSLTYDTIYLRDDTADPDTQAVASSRARLLTQSGYLALNSDNGFKWTQSDYRPDVYYLEDASGGDPGLPGTGPVAFAYERNSDGTLIGMGVAGGLKIDKNILFVDSDYYDELGYKTVYVNWAEGDPDVSSPPTVIYANFSEASIPSFFGIDIVTSEYEWTQVGSTDEWYLQARGTGDPGVSQPFTVNVFDPTESTNNWYKNLGKSTVGSLGEKQWAWGQDPGTSFDTIYVYSEEDPNVQPFGYGALYYYTFFATEKRWNQSATANEWYVTEADGTELTLSKPSGISVDDVEYTEGTIGSLAENEWDYGKLVADGLSNDTIYIYSTTDPNGVAPSDGLYTDYVKPKKVTLPSSTGDYDYYLVDRINDNEELYIFGSLNTDIAGTVPQFYYGHNAFNSDYKLNVQSWATGVIYNAPTIRDSFYEDDISGPFYASLTKGDWKYGGKVTVDDEFEGTGTDFSYQPLLASNGIVYVQAFANGLIDSGSTDVGYLGQSNGLGEDNSWTRYVTNNHYGATVTLTYSDDVDSANFVSIQYSEGSFYLAGSLANSTADKCYPGVAYTASPGGLTWTTKVDTGLGEWDDSSGVEKANTDFMCISATSDGTNIVTANWRASDDRVHLRYSDDNGATWNDAPIGGGNAYFTGDKYSKIRWTGNEFVVCGSGSTVYYSSDGTAFTSETMPGTVRDIAYNGLDLYAAVNQDGVVYTSEAMPTVDGWESVTLNETESSGRTNWIVWDSFGERFMVNDNKAIQYSKDFDEGTGGDGIRIQLITDFTQRNEPKAPSNIVSDFSTIAYALYDGGAEYLRHMVISRYDNYFWDVDLFAPLSDIYRASSFIVLEGYVILLGTREWEEDKWVYYPRRARFTSPGTYDDFESTGSGFADAPGEGAFLDGRPVNGRGVVFETNRVSAIVPRGDITDPFDYDVIKEDFSIISNPVVVDDKCYVIGDDGLLYGTDGVNLSELGSSFDLTKFDDFNEKKPVYLNYSRLFKCLTIYQYDMTKTEHSFYLVSLDNGTVSRIIVPKRAAAAGDDGIPTFITGVDDSVDKRMTVSYSPDTSQSEEYIRLVAYGAGRPITGRDIIKTNDFPFYWRSYIESGEFYLAPEGQQAALKHVLLRTDTENEVGAGTDLPYASVLYRDLKDSDWNTPNTLDFVNTSVGTIDIDNTGVTIEGLPITNVLIVGDDITNSISNLPVPAEYIRFYTYTGGAYTAVSPTTSGRTATFSAAIPTGTSVYGYWNNNPIVCASVGDVLEDPYEFYRITAITSITSMSLDHNQTSGETVAQADIVHKPTVRLESGEGGEVPFGANKLLDGGRFRVEIYPVEGQDAPTTIKLTGISFGFIPQGRKILKPSGG